MSEFLKFEVNLDNFITDLNTKLKTNNDEITKFLDIKDKTYMNFVKPLQMMDEYLSQFFTPLLYSHLLYLKIEQLHPKQS